MRGRWRRIGRYAQLVSAMELAAAVGRYCRRTRCSTSAAPRTPRWPILLLPYCERTRDAHTQRAMAQRLSVYSDAVVYNQISLNNEKWGPIRDFQQFLELPPPLAHRGS